MNADGSVYIVDGCRTPFLKARGARNPFGASDLAVAAGRALLLRQPFAPADLDELILGCAMPGADEANIARVTALRLGCGHGVTAWTVQRNCASGMQALDAAAARIRLGRSHLVLAGGTEAMSHAPLLFGDALADWLAQWNGARDWRARARSLTRLRPAHFKPVPGLLRGLTDPIAGLSMGQTAENLAYRFHIERERMDAYALDSHRRLAHAVDENRLGEIATIYDGDGKVYAEDDGLRRDTSMERLAALKPVFDRPFGLVTAGNSAQVTDGAALLLLASAEAVARWRLPVLGRLVDSAWAGVDPALMGLGPAHAALPLLQRHGLTVSDIDYWEINEAFAAQVLAVLAAWQDPEYCRQALGLPGALGAIDPARLNVDGGAIALGHPVGASGARIVLHLLHVLKTNAAQRGIASLCIGGGQGGAMLIENGLSGRDRGGDDDERA